MRSRYFFPEPVSGSVTHPVNRILMAGVVPQPLHELSFSTRVIQNILSGGEASRGNNTLHKLENKGIM